MSNHGGKDVEMKEFNRNVDAGNALPNLHYETYSDQQNQMPKPALPVDDKNPRVSQHAETGKRPAEVCGSRDVDMKDSIRLSGADKWEPNAEQTKPPTKMDTDNSSQDAGDKYEGTRDSSEGTQLSSETRPKDQDVISGVSSNSGNISVQDSGARPKEKQVSNIQPWKEFYVVIQTRAGQTPQVLANTCIKNVKPYVVQYLLQCKFPDVKQNLKKVAKDLERKIKDITQNKQSLIILYHSGKVSDMEEAESDINDFVVCIENLAKWVNCRLEYNLTDITDPNEVLEDFLDGRYISVYYSEKKVYIVGIVSGDQLDDIKSLLKKRNFDDTSASIQRCVPVSSHMDLELLEYFGFQQYLQDLKINVTVEIDKERQSLILYGKVEADIDDAIRREDDFWKTLSKRDLPVQHKLIVRLLTLQRIQDKIMEICTKEKLLLLWEPDESEETVTVYSRCDDEEAVKTFDSIIKHLFSVKSYYMKKMGDEEPFAKCKTFEDFVLVHEGRDLVSHVENNDLIIATLKEVDFKISELEQDFRMKCITKQASTEHVDVSAKEQILAEQTHVSTNDQTCAEQVNVSNQIDDEHLKEEAEQIEADGPLEHEKLQILRKFEFLQMMETKQPGFKGQITDDTMVFTGASKRTVKDAVNDFINAMKKRKLQNLQPAHLKCLALPGVVEYVKTCISRKKLLCHWFINKEENTLKIYTKDDASRDQVTDILTKTVGPIEFSNTKDLQQVFAHSDLQTVLRKHEPYIVIDSDSEEMVIWGPDFVCKSIMDTYRKVDSQKIASYKRQLSSEELKFVKEKLGINNHTMRYFQKRRQKEWNEFLSNFRLKTEIDELGNVLVCGAAKDAREAVSKFSKTPMFSKMKWSCEVMCPEEVKKQLEKRTINSIEEKHQCSIELETDNGQVQQQQIGQWVSLGNKLNLHVVLVHSNAFEVAADVMLIPTNEQLLPTDISCDFFEKGKSIWLDEQKRKQVSKDVQSIYVSSHSGNLPCQMIAYFPIGEGRDGKVTQTDVKKGLKDLFDAVEKGNFQSLVIPVKIASTVPETTFLHWFIEVYNGFYNSFSCLQQIYLSVLFTTKTENLVEILNKGIHNDLEYYDFRSMIENFSYGKRMGQQANITVKLSKGKLVEQEVDVIVNSCNRNLNLAVGAISASIIEKGGKNIQAECKNNWAGGISFGQVIKTSAGNMDFQFVLHGSLPVWTPGARISSLLLQKLVFDALVETEKAGCSSIAFPVFATGQLEYPWDEVARVMMDSINKYGRMRAGKTSVKEVTIVLYEKDEKSVMAFEKRKLQAEKVQFQDEDSDPPPFYILTSRSENVRLQIIPLKDSHCHHCEVLVQFVTVQEATEIRKQDENSPFIKKGIELKKLDSFLMIKVYAGNDEKTMKNAINLALAIVVKERIASMAFSLRNDLGLKYKLQTSLIKDSVISIKNRYLQNVKVIIPCREAFDNMIAKTMSKQEDEKKKWFGKLTDWGNSVFSANKHQWKCVSYSDIVENPRLLIAVVAGKASDITLVKMELEKAVERAMKKEAEKLGVTIRQEKHENKWIRVSSKRTRNRQASKPVTLSDEISKQIDDAYKQNLPSVEIEEKDGVYFYQLEKHEFHIIGQEDCNGIFYKQDDKEATVDQGSSVDPVSPVTNDPKEGKQTSAPTKEDVIKETNFYISPLFRSPTYQNMILEMIKIKGLKFDATTWKVTCPYDSMVCLNRQLMEKIKTQVDVITTETGSAHISPSAGEPTTHDDITPIISIDMGFMDYKMLKFFCPDCKILQGDVTYDKGKLIYMLLQDETEDIVKQIINSKLIHLGTFNTMEVTMPATMKIDNTKWQEVKREVNAITPGIFCFRSNDGKTLTLKSNKYEQLQTAKVKCEFVLGLKTQGKGRRNRVIATDPQYNKDDLAVVNNSSANSDKRGSSNFARSFSSSSSSSPMALPMSPVSELTFNSDGIIIKVYVGNILNLDVECIVNAANETLSHGGGVADVISRAAGYKFQDESDDFIRQHGQLKATECCTTSAGNLKYKCVIHAVGPRFYQYTDRRKCADHLEQTIVNCFCEADTQNIKSIALPAISSGIFGVPKEICSQQYCAGAKRYCSIYGKTTSLKEIHFMDKDPGMVRLIQDEFSKQMLMTKSSKQSGMVTPSPSRVSNFSEHSLEKSSDRDETGRNSQKSSTLTPKQDSEETKSTYSNAVSSGKFRREFRTKHGLKVCVVLDDITAITVDVVICPQDEFCRNYGRIAKAISNKSNEKYRSDVTKITSISRCEVKKVQASPSTLPFKYVLHTVAPRWDKNAVKDNKKFMKELDLTIRNILCHCSDSKGIKTTAIPVLGVGADGHETQYITYAKSVVKQITKESESGRLNIKELYIVSSEYSMASAIADMFDKESIFTPVTSFSRTRKGQGKKEEKFPTQSSEASSKGESQPAESQKKLGSTVKGGNADDCAICMDAPNDPRQLKCGHVFCQYCISQQFKLNSPKCPTCGSIQGTLTGNQPRGRMTVTRDMEPLTGYPQCGRIVVTYQIYSGTQGPEHKTPGKPFEGFSRSGYLPDNDKGQLVAKLLRVAFDRKLIFTIGDSRTTGKTDVVTWNDIHHKTNPKPYTSNQFGYPDPTYLDRVLEELAAKGVTEADIKPGTPLY